MKGENIITAIEYIANVKPIIEFEIPFNSNSKGKKGAIKAYAVLETSVASNSFQANLSSYI